MRRTKSRATRQLVRTVAGGWWDCCYKFVMFRNFIEFGLLLWNDLFDWSAITRD
jgi:hypothetical protein